MRRIWISVCKYAWRVGNPDFPGRHALLRALALVGILLAAKAFARPPTYLNDPTYLIDTWEIEDGLPENSATASGAGSSVSRAIRLNRPAQLGESSTTRFSADVDNIDGLHRWRVRV